MLFFESVLPILKKYVLIFQSKEPMIHKLRVEQLELLREFLACSVKSHVLKDITGKKMKKPEVTESSENIFPTTLISMGGERVKKVLRETLIQFFKTSLLQSWHLTLHVEPTFIQQSFFKTCRGY